LKFGSDACVLKKREGYRLKTSQMKCLKTFIRNYCVISGNKSVREENRLGNTTSAKVGTTLRKN
jgi:hypothetical protein